MKNKEKHENGLITWKNCLTVAITAFLLYLAVHYWSLVANLFMTALSSALPIFVGFAIAYALNILMSQYEKIYFPRKRDKKFVEKTRLPVCMVLTFLTFAAAMALLIWIVVPELILCITFLVAKIPPLIQKLLASNWVREFLPEDIFSTLKSTNWTVYVKTIIDNFSSQLGSAAGAVISLVTSTFSLIVTIFISIIFSIYMLVDRDNLSRQIKRLSKHFMTEKHFGKVSHIAGVVNDSFRRYVVGQFTEAIILGILCTAGMLIFRFPYAGMIGTLIGFTALIPIAGAYIGAGVGALMILTVSPMKALFFLIFILVLQQLEGNLIYPKVVGNSLGLPAIWVLAAVTVGGGLMGILGMIIGVPIAATLYRLLREELHRREAKAASETVGTLGTHTVHMVKVKVKKGEKPKEADDKKSRK